MEQLPEVPESPRFRKWGNFVLSARAPLVLACFALTAFFAFHIKQAAEAGALVDNSTEAFLSPDSDAIITLEAMQEDFGNDVFIQVIVEGDVFTPQFITRLKALHNELAEIDVELLGDKGREQEDAESSRAASDDEFGDEFGDFGEDEGWGDESGGTIIEDATSLINVRRTSWENGGLKVAGLLDDFPDVDLAAIKKEVTADRTMLGRVVNKEGTFAVVVLRTPPIEEMDMMRVYDAAVEVVKRHQAEGFAIQVAGMPALNAALNRTMLGDMQVLFLWSIGISVAMLLLIFRHPLGAFGPLLVVIQSFVWTVGGMALAGVKITIVTNILPAFIIAVGLGDSVHIQSVYRDMRRDGTDNREAIIGAVASTGLPVLFTSLTTAVGLSSFKFAKLGAIQNLGVFGAVGVMAAFVLSVVFLPAFLSLNTRSHLGARPTTDGSRGDYLDRFLAFCDRLSRPEGEHPRRRTRLNLTVGGVLFVAAIWSISTVDIYHNPLSWIPAHIPGKAALTTLDENVGGTASIAMVVQAKPGKDLKDLDVLTRLQKLEARAMAYDDPRRDFNVVDNTTSVLDPVRESWRAINGGGADKYQLPDSQQGVVDMFTMFQNASAEQLKMLATVDLTKTLLMIRVRWLDALSYRPLLDDLQKGIDAQLSGRADVTLTGSVFNLMEVVQALIGDLLRSFGTAFVVITLFMILLLRDLKLGLIAMVPNLMPVVMIGGFMGVAGVALDASTMLIASVAIGIAVDDTIHFLHQFKAHYALHGDVEGAIHHALRHTGRAMTATSLILVGGFSVFMSATMYNVQRFGALIALTVVMALLIDLIFAPALLRAAYATRRRAK